MNERIRIWKENDTKKGKDEDDKSLRKGKTSSVMQGFQQSMIIGKKIR